MHPSNEAAAILSHYFRELARASGLKWSERNASDIARAVELLSAAEAPALDEVPPYVPAIRSDRVTQVFDREDYGDSQFSRSRQRRAVQDDETERLLRREGGGR